LNISLFIVLGVAVLMIGAITAEADAQLFPQYCPSGAIVTAQSQCSGAVGKPDNLTTSILALNNTITGSNNGSGTTAVKAQTGNNKNNYTSIVDQLDDHIIIKYPNGTRETNLTKAFLNQIKICIQPQYKNMDACQVISLRNLGQRSLDIMNQSAVTNEEYRADLKNSVDKLGFLKTGLEATQENMETFQQAALGD